MDMTNPFAEFDKYFSSFKASDGTDIEYIDFGGDKQPLLFIHGYGSSTEMSLPVLMAFKDNYRCVCMTQRGFYSLGGSHPGAPAVGKLGLEQSAKDIREFIEYLGLKDFILFGYSMGSSVSFQYIEMYGCENISKLIIGDMTPKLVNNSEWNLGVCQGHYSEEQFEEDLESMLDDYIAFNRNFLYEASILHTADEVRTREYTPEKKALMDEYASKMGIPGLTAEMMAYVPPQDWPNYKAYWESMGRGDFRETLKKITVPTLAVYADPGSIYDVRTARYIEANVPDCRISPIENSNHGDPIMVKVPEMAKAVYEFLFS